MFSQLAQLVKDISTVRRLTFATTFYPKSMPNYWERVSSFGTYGRQDKCIISADTTRMVMENMAAIDKEAFDSDEVLLTEIITRSISGEDVQLGVVLISPNEICQLCNKPLYIRKDRSSKVTLYDDQHGTLVATHYVKYCKSSRCSFQQYYSFHTLGIVGEVRYNENWETLPIFMSSRETAFTMEMMKRLDKEILIGQLSYKQRADIYNYVHYSPSNTSR